MKRTCQLVAALMVTESSFVLAEARDSSPVELYAANFYDLVVDRDSNTVKGDKGWFVNFYNKNCGHCRSFMPTWAELAGQSGSEIDVGQVSCMTPEGSDICKEYKIRGYPTLIWMPPTTEENRGRMCRYRGPQDQPTFRAFTIEGEWKTYPECENLPGFVPATQEEL